MFSLLQLIVLDTRVKGQDEVIQNQTHIIASVSGLPANYMQLRIKCVRHIRINNVEDILIVRRSPDVRSPIRPLALFQRIPYRDSVCRPMSIRQHRTRDIKTHIQTN